MTRAAVAVPTHKARPDADEMNGRSLPFGCHAWPRYDRPFWQPFIEAATAKSGP